MKQYLLKTYGLAATVLLTSAAGFAQDDAIEFKKDTANDRSKNYDAIIIQRKNGKDAKITVEIKDGKVTINGKPASEYKDGNVIVRHERTGQLDGQAFGYGEVFDGNDLAAPPMPPMAASPFRKQSGALALRGQAFSSSRAFLGVSSEKDDDKDGARITAVTSGSAAEKAGLKEGDVITKLGDKAVDNPSRLFEVVSEMKPDDRVTVTYTRDGKEQKVVATLGKTKNSLARAYALPRMKDLNFDMAPGFEGGGYNFSYGPLSKGRLGVKAQDTEDGKGVKVLEVGDDTPADKAGIKEGDIITRFDGQAVTDAGSLGELARASKDKPSVKVNVARDGKPLEIEIKTPKKLKTANL